MRKWRISVCRWNSRPGRLIPAWMACCVGLLVIGSGCAIKRNVPVVVPSKILNAKSASLVELVSLIDKYRAGLQSLSSTTMRFTITTGRLDRGVLQEYRSAPGYILLGRPDKLLLNIQNPLTKTAVLELASAGDDFSLWLPSRNQFLTGKNSGGELVLSEDEKPVEFNARPIHIFRAILPLPIESAAAKSRFALEEEQDEFTRYYTLSIYHEGSHSELLLDRKLWIERTDFSVVREQTYEGAGRLIGAVRYSDYSFLEGVPLPLSIEINRPVDGYSLHLEFKNWRLNSEMPETAFIKQPPAGARVIPLREKRKEEKP
jgi:outer membrane lipoprotein-sorting protein